MAGGGTYYTQKHQLINLSVTYGYMVKEDVLTVWCTRTHLSSKLDLNYLSAIDRAFYYWLFVFFFLVIPPEIVLHYVFILL